MTDLLEWSSCRVAHDGASERPFRLVRSSGTVPGVLWMPDPPLAEPGVVLLGHGGSGHKRSERIAGLASWFASHAGLAAVAIDGPYHGDRVASPMTAHEYQARIAAEGIEVVLDRMTDDWRAALDSLGALRIVDATRVGYLGMSMGTRFGLPLAAAMGGLLQCAVFGKFGLWQGPALHEGLAAPEAMAAAAQSVSVPVLFHLQWHDEIFPRDGQLALFDLLGSQDKQLIAYSGQHAETWPGAVAYWRDFIADHMASGI